MADINKKIGLKIRELRKTYGLSQIQLAEKINLSFQQIQKYEKGITAISVFRLQQIADAFGIHASAFLETENQLYHVEETTPAYGPVKRQPIPSQMFSKEEMVLLKSFRKISNKKIRQGLILQVKGFAEMEKEKA